MSDEIPSVTYAGYEVQIPDPYDRLPELAKRLGVEPLSGTYSRSWVVRTQKGETYDVYELLFAFLDRMDRIVA